MSKTPEIPIAIASVVSEGGGGGAEEMAHATMAPTIGPRGETSQTQIRELEKLGLPAGLADVVAKSSEACAVRFWIVSWVILLRRSLASQTHAPSRALKHGSIHEFICACVSPPLFLIA